MKNQKIVNREKIIRVLLNGPTEPDDMKLAAQLIREGLADGSVRDNYREADGIPEIHWRGSTLRGLEYADRLTQELKRESFGYRLWIALYGVGTFVLGAFVSNGIGALFN